MWLVGGFYGCGYQEVSVRMYRCGQCVCVKRYIDFLILIIPTPYSTCISSFLQKHPYFFVHFKMFFSFFIIIQQQCCDATHTHHGTSYVLYAYLYCVYVLVGGAISIRDLYICAYESHAIFHRPLSVQ